MNTKQLTNQLRALPNCPAFFTPPHGEESHAITGVMIDTEGAFLYCNDNREPITAHALAAVLDKVDAKIYGSDGEVLRGAQLIDETGNTDDSWIDIYS